MPTLLAPESASACSWLAHAWTPKACAVVCPLPASGALPQAPRCSAFLLSLVLFSVFCFFVFCFFMLDVVLFLLQSWQIYTSAVPSSSDNKKDNPGLL